jgi:hypothetical protein
MASRGLKNTSKLIINSDVGLGHTYIAIFEDPVTMYKIDMIIKNAKKSNISNSIFSLPLEALILTKTYYLDAFNKLLHPHTPQFLCSWSPTLLLTGRH